MKTWDKIMVSIIMILISLSSCQEIRDELDEESRKIPLAHVLSWNQFFLEKDETAWILVRYTWIRLPSRDGYYSTDVKNRESRTPVEFSPGVYRIPLDYLVGGGITEVGDDPANQCPDLVIQKKTTAPLTLFEGWKGGFSDGNNFFRLGECVSGCRTENNFSPLN